MSNFVKQGYWDGTETVTGILHYDIDGEFDAALVRELLVVSFDIYYAFTSPNGGLKFAIRTDLSAFDDFKFVWEHFEQLFNELLTQIDLIVDKAVCAINSQCYMSVDPTVYYNPDVSVYTIPERPLEVVYKHEPISVGPDWGGRILAGIQKNCMGLDYTDRLKIITAGKRVGLNKSELITIVDNAATANHTTKAKSMYVNCTPTAFSEEQAQNILSKYAKLKQSKLETKMAALKKRLNIRE